MAEEYIEQTQKESGVFGKKQMIKIYSRTFAFAYWKHN